MEADPREVVLRVLGRVAPELDLTDVDDDAPLQETFELDSMDFLDLVAGVHEATGIDIPERDYPRLGSLGGLVTYLQARTNP